MDQNIQHDVFISYHTADEQLVKQIAEALIDASVSVYFAPWTIKAGDDLIDSLESNLQNSSACAVFVGANGLGPWQSVEIKTAIVQQIDDDNYSVIPVILPGGKLENLPKFLRHKRFLEYNADLKSLVVELCRGIPNKGGNELNQKRKYSEQDQDTFEHLKPVYYKLMSADWRRLRLEGLDAQASDAAAGHSMLLDQVYVGLLTTRRKEKQDPEWGLTEEDSSLSALEAVSGDASLVVLLGQPGSGKSTFLRYLAFILLEVDNHGDISILEKQLPGWTCGSLFPVFLSLPRMVRHMDETVESGSAQLLESLILSEFEEDNPDLKDFGGPLLAYLQNSGGLVLLDGLDEVNSRLRVFIKDSIQRFQQLYDQCRVVCTCRTHSYRGGNDWQLQYASEYELAAFNNKQIHTFIDQWYGSLSTVNPRLKDEYETKAGKLNGALSKNDTRQLHTIASNPLLLTVMAIVHTHYSELPDSRVQVYKACVELLLDRWSVKRSERSDARSLFDELRECGIKKAKVYQGLRALAFEGLRIGESKRFGDASRGLVGETLAELTLRRYLREEGTRIFLQHCKTDNGLLLAQGLVPRDAGEDEDPVTAFSFPHLTFQEYLAACRLCELPENKSKRQQLSIELAGDSAWREVIRFQVEHLCFDESENRWYDALTLLRGLIPDKQQPTSDQDWRRVALGGELVPLVRQEAIDDEIDMIPKQRIHDRLVELLQYSNALSTSPIERASAGRFLANLGDQRPGVAQVGNQNLPGHAWIPIPGTVKTGLVDGFRLGQGTKQDRLAEKVENWPGDESGVEIQPFHIAAYPVTYAQFACFVNAGKDGYMNDRYWTIAGLRHRGKSEAPNLWNDPDWHIVNHPVIGISWYEAVAYCCWLTDCWEEILGERQWTIRLPTEAEWEWAARGPEGRFWPWGDVWKNGACNSKERGLNRTIVVGSDPTNRNWVDATNSNGFPDLPDQFLQNEEVNAVFDLVGNVWEWCSTKWIEAYALETVSGNHSEQDYVEGRDLRVLRGGSFWNEKPRVRSGARDWSIPRIRYYNVGFRCCASTSSKNSSES